MRWIEEWGTAFWKIVRKASTVGGAPRPNATFNELLDVLAKIVWLWYRHDECIVSRSHLAPDRPSIRSRFALDTACACLI